MFPALLHTLPKPCPGAPGDGLPAVAPQRTLPCAASLRFLSGRVLVASVAVLLLLPGLLRAQDKPPAESIFSEPLRLEASTVTATVPPVKVVEDTVVYNAAAYRVAEDAALEDLLKKIPGLEVDGSSVTLHGRQVNRLLVNGKLYFGGDVSAGLKNIQADMVDQVFAYEMESDNARLSGVDDGEEVPVLDVRIKKRMMGRWQGTATGAGGTSERYRGRLNAGKITQESQTNLIAGIHNMPVGVSLTNASLSQLGTGGSGDPSFRNAGLSCVLKRPELEINANVQYTGNNRLVDRETRSQSVLAGGTNYSEATARSLSGNNRLSAEMTLEWRPRGDLTLFCKPTFSYAGNDSWSSPFTTTFSADPDLDGNRETALVNTVRQLSANYSDKADAGFVLQLTRRLSKKGRTLSLRGQTGFSLNRSESFNDYRADYYRKKRDPSIRKQYLETPNDRLDGSLQLSFSEPLGQGFHMQAFLNGRIIRNWSDRVLYSMEEIAPEWTAPQTLSLQAALRGLPAGWADVLNPDLSSYGLYTSYILTGTVNLRIYRKKWNATLGVNVKPQWGVLEYRTGTGAEGRDPSFVCYAAPNLNLRYNKDKSNHFAFSYRSWSGTPSAYNLIPVRSGTNPLNIHLGNPDLKPSFTHRIGLNYRNARLKRQESFVLDMNASLIQNAFSSSTEYDPETGGRTVLSRNISGNWNAGGSAVWNKTLGTSPFSLSNHAAFQYNNDVSYLYNTQLKADEINTMKRLMLKERLDLSWRSGPVEVIARAGGEYTDEQSVLRPDLHQQPFTFIGGAEVTADLPWKLRLTTDATVFSQHGYAYPELNRTLCIWNASLSRRLFKGKGSIRLAGYDLLGQQVNMTRRFNSNSRSVSTYNGVNRYALLQFFYRFSGKDVRSGAGTGKGAGGARRQVEGRTPGSSGRAGGGAADGAAGVGGGAGMASGKGVGVGNSKGAVKRAAKAAADDSGESADLR